MTKRESLEYYTKTADERSELDDEIDIDNLILLESKISELSNLYVTRDINYAGTPKK